MEKNKDIRRSFWRYAAVLTALALLFLFLKRDNLVRWIQAGMEIRSQQAQIEALEEGNRLLEDSIRFLTSDKDSLEKFAREKYHFAQKGDDVFIVE
ncbi:MAG: septum formation initiator family protein [Bacteroidales bacterium]|nr:septum formation initiator family protein [Bacteroidales bacterium]